MRLRGQPGADVAAEGRVPVLVLRLRPAASGADVLTEQISLTYMEAQLDGKGGLTGTLDS